jgi:hypothetical protein
MVESVQKVIGGNLNIPRIYRKEDLAVTAEKDLIAEVQYHEEEDPSVELVYIVEKSEEFLPICNLTDSNINELPRSRAARYHLYAMSSNNLSCPRYICL